MKESLQLPLSSTNIMLVKTTKDFIILANPAPSLPRVYLEEHSNALIVFKYSRILAWATLLALVISSLLLKLGCPWFEVDSYVPALEMIALAFRIVLSKESEFLKYSGVADALLGGVVYVRAKGSMNW